MPGSGVALDENVKGCWRAGQDFDMRNLRVKKGEPLPYAWTLVQNRKYLLDNYGKDACYWEDAKPTAPAESPKGSKKRKAA